MSRSIATALDDATTPQQAASYVASLPANSSRGALRALCFRIGGHVSQEALDDDARARRPVERRRLLSVVAAGVARASAERPGEAVAAKAATKFAAACSSAAKGAEPDASKDAKNLSADFVADAQVELPPPPPKAGPKIIAPKAAFDGTDSEPGTAKEAQSRRPRLRRQSRLRPREQVHGAQAEGGAEGA